MSSGPGERTVGRVHTLWRYPVKSMAGEQLVDGDVGWHGLAGDRRWAFVRPGREHSGVPWLTIGKLPIMNRYQPVLEDPERADRSGVHVTDPDGSVFDVADPRLAAQLGENVSVVKLNHGVFDVAPVAILTLQSITSLSRLTDDHLETRRFRPNIVVDATGGEEYPEDGWVGRSLRVGPVVLRVDQRDERCGMVNVNPDSLAREPEVLRAIARERDLCLGVYGSVVTPGRVSVGSPVVLVDA